jgi:vancomycin resistance protein VanW
MLEVLNKPQERHPFRRYLGKQYYCFRRWCMWQTQQSHFAKSKSSPLEHCVFQHKTPLLRRLKDVDMYLQHNKITNLRLALEKIDGICLQPNETFSFWFLVGKPTAAKGYKEGLVLQNGKITKGTGGGLCQLGNLLYWMALHSPLKVTERWRHSYDVFPDEKRLLPFGSGATLAYNYIDLQIKNETSEMFQFNLHLTETDLMGQIRSTKPPEIQYEVFEKEHLIRAESWGGYSRHNRIHRKLIELKSSEEIAEEFVTENHALMMYQPFITSG